MCPKRSRWTSILPHHSTKRHSSSYIPVWVDYFPLIRPTTHWYLKRSIVRSVHWMALCFMAFIRTLAVLIGRNYTEGQGLANKLHSSNQWIDWSRRAVNASTNNYESYDWQRMLSDDWIWGSFGQLLWGPFIISTTYCWCVAAPYDKSPTEKSDWFNRLKFFAIQIRNVLESL